MNLVYAQLTRAIGLLGESYQVDVMMILEF